MKEPIDIIIKSWNAVEYTQLCIESIKKNTDHPYRIFIIDDGSSQETLKILRKLKDIILIENGENKGASHTAQKGFESTTSEKFILMDSDVVVPKGWLTSLLSYDDPTIGIISPVRYSHKYRYPESEISSRTVWENVRKKEISPEKALDEYLGGSSLADFSKLLIGYNKIEDSEVICPPGFVSSSCILVNRACVKKAGGLTLSEFISYGEDVDLCWRMGLAGFKIIRSAKTYVHHFEHSSVISNKADYNTMMIISNKKLFEKWSQVIFKVASDLSQNQTDEQIEKEYPFVKLFKEMKQNETGNTF